MGALKEALKRIIAYRSDYSNTRLSLAGIGLRTIPEEVFCLESLEYLDLSGNKLTRIPGTIGELKNLAVINLDSNRIRRLPREIATLDGLRRVSVEDNPLEIPPIEIVSRGLDSMKNYFEFMDEENTSKIHEAKLLIVGQGNVGKTCLMKKMIDNNYHVERQGTTEGIEIREWNVTGLHDSAFQINCWDFGGQEIYHATHQFFLTRRSLYLLLWEARKDDDMLAFDYWLNIIRLLSDDAPVLVIQNKIDERLKHIDQASLTEKFRNIKGFYNVSALKGNGINELRNAVCKEITKLPHIGDILPSVWVTIRRRLELIEENYISKLQYIELCDEYGVDPKRALYVSQYYHDLGVFLHFQDNAILNETIFLKPEWATGAVYKLLDNRAIQSSFGQFRHADLSKVWADYPQDKHLVLIELMKKFELCFQIPDTKTYIAPELLRSDRPEIVWDYTDNLRFEYQYDFMPAGIITRFIVICHHMIDGSAYWKYGVKLTFEETNALIVSEPLDKRIRLWISGKNKKQLLSIVREKISYIHKTLNRPFTKEMIPCNCSVCRAAKEPHFYEYAFLKKCVRKSVNEILCESSLSYCSIDALIGDIEISIKNKRGEKQIGGIGWVFADTARLDELRSMHKKLLADKRRHDKEAGIAVNKRLFFTSFLILSIPLSAIWLIQQLGWATAEPLLYCLSLVALPVAYLYFAVTKTEMFPSALYKSFVDHKRSQLYAREQFDVDRFRVIAQEIKDLEERQRQHDTLNDFYSSMIDSHAI